MSQHGKLLFGCWATEHSRFREQLDRSNFWWRCLVDLGAIADPLQQRLVVFRIAIKQLSAAVRYRAGGFIDQQAVFGDSQVDSPTGLFTS